MSGPATASSTPEANRLRWLRADEYHARSECGRFTVARKTVNGVDWYIAYQLQGNGTARSTELGATQVPSRATDAERSAAIRDMKQLCEAAVAASPTNQPGE